MSSRQTWFWVFLAAGLLVCILVFQRFQPKLTTGPARVLPEIQRAAITSIQVRPATHPLGIRAERTNGGWQLTQPLVYPAQSTNVDRLAEALEGLVSASFLTAAELRGRPRADEEYGFTSPQASIVIHQPDYRATLLIGALTTPGDQVFVQVVGREGVFITDAGWLALLPKTADDWRDTSLLPPDLHRFDRLAATNSGRAFVLHRESNKLWRMVWPLNSARADHARIHDALGKLERLQIRQFVSDDPTVDAESFGLAPPALEVSLGSGTNVWTVLQIGKALPTATNQVYARRLGHPGIFAVDIEPLSVWRSASVNDFRDHHVLTPDRPIASVEVRGEEAFSLTRQTNNTWRVLPADFPTDSALVQEFLGALTGLQIVQFAKDVVNPPDLPQFGLAAPARRYIVKAAPSDSAAASNAVIAELNFGIVTNQPDKVFVWRPDESSVYAIATNDYVNLPSKGWQFRERRLWNYTADDVTGLTIRQPGKVRELVRTAAHKWSFAPGSQGIINDLAVEETVRGLLETSAVVWVARGEQARPAYGLAEAPHQVTVKLRNGGAAVLDFGREAPSNNRYTGVLLDGQYWIFELSWILYRDAASYLSIP